MKSMMYALMMALVLFSSCEDSCDDCNEPTRADVTAKFKSYFYRDGDVYANKLEMCSNTEWAVAAENSGRACEVFKDITGKDAPLTENYGYDFRSSDGACRIVLEGSKADKDGMYAVFRVSIPECPEITKIYVMTKEVFLGIGFPEDEIIIL